MDPLSDVLSLLRVRNYHSATLSLGGDWAFTFPEREGIKFTAVVKGSCWLQVEGEQQPQRLQQGDCFLMTRGMPFSLYSDMSQPVMDSDGHFQTLAADELALHYGGDDIQLVGGRFDFSGVPTQLLLSSLPSLVHVHANDPQASLLRWALERFTSELQQKRPGRSLMNEHLAHLMLVEVLRTHLATLDSTGIGWFYGLADRNLSVALSAIHADPAHRWSVQELAQLATMSRSAFALRFKQVVGAAPMEYLTHWRMLLASDRLKNSDDAVSTIAFSLGYESESAFSTAFKRVMSQSPRHYVREHTAQA
ncbi:AraC family transcriptional regulator [Pseudomonas haemolytica]|uniref:AraC family transcriptional regulator n=1 Tax=Pseudomonas haemolytica TaxID=2600065 RepID=A0A5P1DEW2_9PSED|nr:AraC family transcriptional regulator [Pseudomonas haemolytica]MBJ2246784.1 AraC family transcriptional regulator [Pseudomonas haemolytica]MBJ2274640.1 AraC family transcriptional regulator [Pseudomonas haemolytica]MBK3449522.1 AraC family transcriptional regulator [Pseudomonas haemolytica]MBK3457569.1 AraC family transcriptional regulator [Pseudomonas haemolytica]MRJ39055.1 AraC family transcriptional regulator [Pseudomonas haemolytica]